MTEFWDISVASEPLTADVFYDAVAGIAGDSSPELRDRYHALAVEERARSFLRTITEIRAEAERGIT